MGGFGGALKNIAIGVASARGKGHIHCNGKPFTKFEDMFTADHDSFLESMADADSSVMDYLGQKNMAYINAANRLSIDCDCDAHPHDPGKASLIERMESKNWINCAIQAPHPAPS